MLGLVREVPEPLQTPGQRVGPCCWPREADSLTPLDVSRAACCQRLPSQQGGETGSGWQGGKWGRLLSSAPLTGPLRAPSLHWKAGASWTYWWSKTASRPHPDGIHVAELGQACLWPFNTPPFSVGGLIPATEPTFLCWPVGQHPLLPGSPDCLGSPILENGPRSLCK